VSSLPTKRTMVLQRPVDSIMLFFGPPGVGKTTFVNSFSKNVLFLSSDRGTRFLDTMRVEAFNWNTVNKTLAKLEKKGAPHYDIIALDHVDDFTNYAEDWVCNDLQVESLTDKSLPWGKGWRAYKKQMDQMVRRILSLNSGLVYIAHETIKTVTVRGREVDKVMPAMSKSAWNLIVPMADIVGYCGFDTIKVKVGGKTKKKEIRVLETVPREDLYCKDRTNRRKPEGVELLDGAAFLKTFGDKNGKVKW
jgi:hypothetical protein